MNGSVRGALLYAACARERLGAVRRLLREARAEDLAWARPGTGWTALHVAAEMQSESVIELLVSAGAPLEARDDQGWTCLFVAVDVDIDSAIQDGDPPNLRTVQLLLRLGANPVAVALDGNTPATLAGQYACHEAVEMLERRRLTRS